MNVTRDELENKLKDISSGKTIKQRVSTFKYQDKDVFLLTEDGFLRLMKSDIYDDCFSERLTLQELRTGRVVKFLRKYFKSPYYIAGTAVYYFDPITHAEITLYGSLRELIKISSKYGN